MRSSRPSELRPEGFTRLPGWERRLPVAIAAVRETPYLLGRNDCFRLACLAVEALTGEDLWRHWAGRYATRRQALKLIADYGGSFTEAFSNFFGTEPEPMGRARRGDIAEFVDGTEPHLGVVTGVSVAMYVEAGLDFVNRGACRHCWRIG